MKYTLLITLLLTCSAVFSQDMATDKKLLKIKGMYDAEKYEDCAYKAENLTLNDKYRKSPYPYLYITKCYLAISKMDPADLDQEYKDPMKLALKYASKFAKKDKDGSAMKEYAEFFSTFKAACLEYADGYKSSGNYKKAAGIYKAIIKYDPTEFNVQYMLGACHYMCKNVGEGGFAIDKGFQGVKDNYFKESYEGDAVSEPLLIEALLLYTQYCQDNSKTAAAKETIEFANRHFSDNAEVSAKHSALNP